ncbi:MAG: CRISPR-associated protein Cas4 [Methylobacter sp.]|uniref:CRISPR-associated protein Cas4 n=1 Tax=Methylobacter sp. TaxID=2051955 RepID=UPI00258E6B1D|nr:CRISPR-associated protein Cas4 [Methylobacter sp.]MCL7419492.1 CRISPR-associated protein Cas4 [Methylobacter sp.]
MIDEDDFIAISTLQHYSYCPRQCALIHQEQSFSENIHTLRGRRVHEKVDTAGSHLEDGIRIETALPLVSEQLGLSGIADLVEVLPDGMLRPIEYKHGRRKESLHDDLQVAAQAICLEEMTGKTITEGIIYHHSSRRRRSVPMTSTLRSLVRETVEAVRDMLKSGHLPPPIEDFAKCRECSLQDICQPALIKAAHQHHDMAQTLFNPEDEET